MPRGPRGRRCRRQEQSAALPSEPARFCEPAHLALQQRAALAVIEKLVRRHLHVAAAQVAGDVDALAGSVRLVNGLGRFSGPRRSPQGHEALGLGRYLQEVDDSNDGEKMAKPSKAGPGRSTIYFPLNGLRRSRS